MNDQPRFSVSYDLKLVYCNSKFLFGFELLAVEHEDVVCKLFPHTFEAKESAWYFGFQSNSIAY